MSTLVSGIMKDPFERPIKNALITLNPINNSFVLLAGKGVTATTDENGEYSFVLEPASYQVLVTTNGRSPFYGAITVTANTAPSSLNELILQSAMESELPLNYAEYFQQVQSAVKDDADRAHSAADSIGNELQEAKDAAASSAQSALESGKSSQDAQQALAETKVIANKFTDLDQAVSETRNNASQTHADAQQVATDRAAADIAADRAEKAAGSAETVNERNVRVPQNETINALPSASLRANSLASFDDQGQSSIKKISELAPLDENLLVPISNIPSIPDEKVTVKKSQTGTIARTQEQINNESVSIYDFGIAINSTSDQTAKIASYVAACIAGGRPVYFPSGTYICQLPNIAQSVTVCGDGMGLTILKRPEGSTVSMLSFSGSQSYVVLKDITIDGNKSKASNASTLVTFKTEVASFSVSRIRVTNTSGSLITFGDNNSAKQSSGFKHVSCCRFDNGTGPGVNITQINGIHFTGNEVDNNTGTGVSCAWYTFPPVADAQQKNFFSQNSIHHNGEVGIFAIGFMEGGTPSFPLYGSNSNANSKFIFSDNYVAYNKSHGMGVQVNDCTVSGNIVEYNGDYNSSIASALSGILVNSRRVIVSANVVRGNSGFGVDMGGSVAFTVNGNIITDNATGNNGGNIGLNLGGTQYGNVSGNLVGGNGTEAYGVQIMVPGYDGGNTSFQTLTTAVHVTGNTIYLGSPTSTRKGIVFYGRPLLCSMTENRSNGGYDNNAFVVQTNEPVACNNNRHSSPMPTIANQNGLVIPDAGDEFVISGGASITNILSFSHFSYINKVSEAVVTDQGSGYDPNSPPTVTFSGGGGSGATGFAATDASGRIITVNITSPGSGYTSAPTITISDPASGRTAKATAVVGVKNFTGRQITMFFDTATTINATNNISMPAASISVPQNGIVKFRGLQSGYFVLESKSF